MMGLADEDEVVGGGGVLEEKAQTAQALGGHEVSVVDNRLVLLLSKALGDCR